MEKIITALKSLVSDIESMRHPKADVWFGGFSEYAIKNEDMMIEWPNLAISVDDAKKAIEEYEQTHNQ